MHIHDMHCASDGPCAKSSGLESVNLGFKNTFCQFFGVTFQTRAQHGDLD